MRDNNLIDNILEKIDNSTNRIIVVARARFINTPMYLQDHDCT